ncbi:neutral zinc metallopeptidase [Nonomuraea sp. NPDC050663]|uniref:neutral zinc metallopeptidase n=1 Tax=Nonomuraea sp. NPDC050663 TaxID=3364370 RepID=UPI0037A73E70
MRIPAIAALSCAFVLAFTSPAAAYPIDEPELTGNALYTYGPLPESECVEKPIDPNNVSAAKTYLRGLFSCLDSTWGQYLAANGAESDPIKVVFVKKLPKKWCGITTGKDDSQFWYCDKTKTVIFQLGKSWLDYPEDLWLFYMAASSYAFHVQNLVGIAEGFDRAPYKGKAELNEQFRRLNLQVNCLSGAFLKSVWPLKGRDGGDLKEFYGLFDDDPDYGKKRSQLYWLKEGFSNADPGDCNTWSASSSRVA